MIPNSISFTRKSPFLLHFLNPSPHPARLVLQSILQTIRVTSSPVQISGIATYSCSHYSSHGKGSVIKNTRQSHLGFTQSGVGSVRVSAISGSGSTSGGGYDGGFGDGNSGGKNEGGGDGKNSRSLISWYLALLGRYPVFTKAVTSAALTLIGDLICQLAIDQVPSLDLKRTALCAFLGLALVGPTLHYWYLYLSRLVTLPGTSGVFLRLILDQILFSPTFIGVFLASLLTLEGRPSQVVPKLQQEWFSTVIANWQLWIPFQFLNFRFVPQQFQVLAANCIALIWNVILSSKAHKKVLQK